MKENGKKEIKNHSSDQLGLQIRMYTLLQV